MDMGTDIKKLQEASKDCISALKGIAQSFQSDTNYIADSISLVTRSIANTLSILEARITLLEDTRK